MKRSTDTRWSPAEIQQNQKEHYAAMAEHPPDRKASEKFHRPAYQAGNLIEAQGQQLWHGDVAEYLARKYKIGDDANGEENNVKNENDRKKTYLRAYRKHGKRIKRIESEIEEIRNMKMYPSSINNGMPHGSNQSDLSSYAVALQEREDELYQEGVKQVQTYKDIEYRINKLENQDERDVMFYKYIKGFTWWQIAQLMEYSESWIYELHGRALKNIQIN